MYIAETITSEMMVYPKGTATPAAHTVQLCGDKEGDWYTQRLEDPHQSFRVTFLR